MENTLSAATVTVLLVLVIPGFIYGRVKAWTTQRPDSDKESLSAALYMNLVRSLVLLILMALADGVGIVHTYTAAIMSGDPKPLFSDGYSLGITALALIVEPAVLGFFMGAIDVLDVVGWVRRKLSMPPQRMFDYAWDQAFAQARSMDKGHALILEVILKKGEPVYGMFGAKGAASRLGGYRDVYLDSLWGMQDGALAQVDEGGILIRGSEIAMIRFIQIKVPTT